MIPPLTGAWHHDLAGGLRKRPLQERSKAMIQCILDTAAELVEEVGYEAVVGSPTLLLDRCGVSRGSFYAFFESPERVLDELSYQGIRQSTANLDAALWSRPGEHWVEIVDALLDLYTTEHRTPLIRELWVRQNLTQRVRDLDHRAIDDSATLVHAQFRKHAPLFDTLTELQCRVAIHTVERLFQYAFIDEPEGDSAIIAEARRMLIDYFAGYIQK
ncbi:TetR family transcriptional regulator [Mycobacterium sp. NS-7484]|nr:TetR family transcriptional regulator [Mycobacterium sp. E802]OMC02357.1 TetR family transcriptional regulator [Mycobacterium sp. NS-7484]